MLLFHLDKILNVLTLWACKLFQFNVCSVSCLCGCLCLLAYFLLVMENHQY